MPNALAVAFASQKNKRKRKSKSKKYHVGRGEEGEEKRDERGLVKDTFSNPTHINAQIQRIFNAQVRSTTCIQSSKRVSSLFYGRFLGDALKLCVSDAMKWLL